MNATVKPQGCTNFRLRRLTRMVSRHYDAHVAASGLKTTQYSLLSHVLSLGPLRPVDLSEAMNVDASTLSRNLKPLLAAGWLTQNEGPDARSRLIAITDAGRAKRAEAQRLWRAAQMELNEMLGVERVMAMHQLIDESIALLQRAGLKDDEESNDE
ncbi:DNA-binding transcriptional repressor MarR [Variovorax sp. PBS-H4]|uniref:MarR family winged helix-turn-helix transcriptional regulator n=1 Tax=Variovorax sp. PBS-H4 TaxID=434008 RepID=UPI0013173D83|nr:MarR family winged helix-turn-helix transcriptional regulator [Variovorax sp. PBS-H4]VTU29524.1 DNA-binding transcriptional repressor MarR [Variovorax sp. PBS-H4]